MVSYKTPTFEWLYILEDYYYYEVFTSPCFVIFCFIFTFFSPVIAAVIIIPFANGNYIGFLEASDRINLSFFSIREMHLCMGTWQEEHVISQSYSYDKLYFGFVYFFQKKKNNEWGWMPLSAKNGTGSVTPGWQFNASIFLAWLLIIHLITLFGYNNVWVVS